MQCIFVTIEVIPEHRDAFIAATRLNHAGSLGEPGCRRFDVLADNVDPGRFYLYEVYANAEAFAAHQRTAHYLAWKEAVAPWMAKPRVAVKAASVLPEPWR